MLPYYSKRNGNDFDLKANVVICPSTEANLGDGIFPFNAFYAKNGNWSIGTDSHIGLNHLEELRWLDMDKGLFITKEPPLFIKVSQMVHKMPSLVAGKEEEMQWAYLLNVFLK
jgi:hypothetical protein